ncbi:FkbM family methyltransferase, partial [Anaerophilus nitritogenes]|uniref:FkbM family methyltransferase n=1 Tax=Anaerophilus nitritogenes TaxID=2498136 RepID=UPI0013EA23B2
KLENEINKITKLENEINKITKLENEINRINALESQLIRIDQLENQVGTISENLDMKLINEKSFFDKNSYAQSGEDTILAYIFYVLGIKNEDITYLDLGANHAKEISNTYYFYKKGAKGVLVEANPELIQELKYYRYKDIILNNAVSTQGDSEIDFYVLSGDGLSTVSYEAALEFCKVNPNIKIMNEYKIKTISVTEIIDQYFGKAPTFISIDIEGLELEILKDIDFMKYRPLVIIVETIEYRPYLAINIKTNEVADYLKTKGYVEYAFTGINSIFIDSEYMKKIGKER